MKLHGGVVRNAPGLILLLAAFFTADQAAGDDWSESPAPTRRQILLRDGWLVKQLETDQPDIGALTRESASSPAKPDVASTPRLSMTIQAVNAVGGRKLTIRALNVEPLTLKWKP